jgi:anti-sigma28 factor (negative regulator of flagellin synthesis)
MSMRIEGQMDAKVVSNTRSAETRAAGPESTTGHMLATSHGTDNVSLSGASGLAALAKQLTPADKQAKIAALTSQVRSGQYRAGASEISRAVVQGLFKN